MDKLRLSALDKRRMQDFEHLLSGKEFGGCFCAAWTNFDETWDERCRARPQENLEHTRSRVLNRAHVGFLVIRDSDGAVVAWTGSGPKTSFPRLKERPGSRTGAWDDGVWAIGCLAIGRSYRGLGYARQIVEALVEEARLAGAKAVEAYPVEPAGDDTAFRGKRAMYEALGFTVAGQEQDGNYSMLRMEKRLA
ncbi:MAG: GNAT family N-acetyltransferase [Elusimicrobia bacterium]|nr:GNAT family N-acetyltransferase [Elusimicrobiota bacterium]